MGMIRVAINGFGRIGRNVFRAWIQNPDMKKKFEIVAINDLAPVSTLAHLLKYDSVMRGFPFPIEVKEKGLQVGEFFIQASQERQLDKLPWKDLKIDIVIESTGLFLQKEVAMEHIRQGAKKVILSAPAKDDVDATVVLGVNEKELTGQEQVISNASCTTNCVAPLIDVIEKTVGVENAMMLTVHAYTSDQNLLDAPHQDLRRSRAAAVSMIPTTTGAMKAVEKIFPSMKGKLSGYAVRVPVPDGSLTDLTVRTKKATSVEEINSAFLKASQTYLKNILFYETDPIVGQDIVGNPYSSIFDSLLTTVISSSDGSSMVRVVSWYDNEWGYSSRLVDLAAYLSEHFLA